MNTSQIEEYIVKDQLQQRYLTLAGIGRMLEYPTPGYRTELQYVAGMIDAHHPEASQMMAAFIEATDALDDLALEEHYTHTFDVSPAAVPYAGVQLFGTESYERGELMARLKEGYAEAGFTAGSELPDHVALLLQAVALLDESRSRELLQYCLHLPLRKIQTALEEASNPYAHLVGTAWLVVDAIIEQWSEAGQEVST